MPPKMKMPKDKFIIDYGKNINILDSEGVLIESLDRYAACGFLGNGLRVYETSNNINQLKNKFKIADNMVFS